MKLSFYFPVCQLGDPFLFWNVSRPHQAWIPEPMKSILWRYEQAIKLVNHKKAKIMHNAIMSLYQREALPPTNVQEMNKKERN